MIKPPIFRPNQPRAILIFMNGALALGHYFFHTQRILLLYATEISALSASEDEFKKRNCKLLGLSVDSLESHFDWLSEMEETYGNSIEFPIIADKNLYVSKLYNMLPADTVVEGPRSALITPPLGRSI